MSYTKGPWKVYHKPLRRGMSKIIEVQDSHGTPVVPWTGFDACDYPKKTNLANAHLISAAPDMYEALSQIVDLLERIGDCRKDAEYIDAAKSALAKAEAR